MLLHSRHALLLRLITGFVFFCCAFIVQAQKTVDTKILDVVYLKDGSKLTGRIIRWDLETSMDLQLATGALITIPKDDIERVTQDLPVASRERYVRGPRPYLFKEEGWYHNASAFINSSVFGGAGVHYVMGYRFNRMLGVGLGTGFESHDLSATRNFVPVYAEARGFFLPKKITPYYAVKVGYGFALRDELSGTVEAKGGIHFSPEVGMRFGGGIMSFYTGIEYKLQNATFTNDGQWWGGGIFTDKVSYRRFELRAGLLF